MTSIVFWNNLTTNLFRNIAGNKILVPVTCMLISTVVWSQEPIDSIEFIDENTEFVSKDSSIALQDTILPSKEGKRAKEGSLFKPKRHSPKLAAIMSSMLPGAGQVYNRRYWKPPIIYGAFAGLTYLAVKNQRDFVTFRDAYRRVLSDSTTNSITVDGQVYSQTNLQDVRNLYKRNRDLAFIFMGVLYGLNILDAAVDAHLFDFDISDDLSMRIAPVFEPALDIRQSFTGVKLNLRL